MNPEFASLLRLGRAERLQLVQDLWDSIVMEGESLPIPSWKADELRHRKEKFAQNPDTGRSWEQIKHL